MIPKNPRVSNPKYLRWVADQSCVNCGAPGPSDAHHIKGVGHFSGAGLKAPDSMAMPLCRECHNMLHNGHIPLGEQYEWLAKTSTKALVEIMEGRLRI